jgi:hypothetical protein
MCPSITRQPPAAVYDCPVARKPQGRFLGIPYNINLAVIVRRLTGR